MNKIRIKLKNIIFLSIYLIPFSVLFEIRFKIFNIHIDYFLIVYIFYLFNIFLNNKLYLRWLYKDILGLIIILFLCIFNFMFFVGPMSNWSKEETIKLNFCILLFLLGISIKFKNLCFQDIFKAFSRGSVIMFLLSFILFFVSLLKFGTPFWCGNLFNYSLRTKNVVGFILTFFFPFFPCIYRYGIIDYLCVIFFLVLIVFNISRETWISLSLGFLFVNIFRFLLFLKIKNYKSILSYTFRSLICLLLFLVIVIFLLNYLPTSFKIFLQEKFLSILELQDPKGSHSIRVRKKYLLEGLSDIFNNPLGHGIGSFYDKMRDVPHNVYLWLLYDIGILGTLLYLTLLMIFLWRLIKFCYNVYKYMKFEYCFSVIWSFISLHILFLFVDNLTLFHTWFYYVIIYLMLKCKGKQEVWIKNQF